MPKNNWKVELIGTKEVEAKIAAVIAEKEAALASALTWGAMLVRNYAKRNHTFKNQTHRLENSIIFDGLHRSNQGHLEAWVRVGQFYGSYVEFGTSKMMPRPFLTPAISVNKKDITAVIRAAESL